MLNIAICDDDIQTTGRMDMLLQEIAKQNFIDIEIEVFWNGKSLAQNIRELQNSSLNHIRLFFYILHIIILDQRLCPKISKPFLCQLFII